MRTVHSNPKGGCANAHPPLVGWLNTLDRRGPKAAEGRDEAASTPITGDRWIF